MVGAVSIPPASLELWPIGNCQVSGLIDNAAGLVWGCVPRVDGDPVFCALLNGDKQDQGVWRFELEDQVSATQHYERNTPILITRLEAKDGSAVEISDFCPRFERAGRMYRPVAYARIVRPVAGTPRLKVTLTPMRDYGAERAKTTYGTNHIRYLIGDQAIRLSTDAPVGYVLEQRPYRVESDQHFFLGPDEPFIGNVRDEVRRMESLTRKYWRLWVRGLATPLEWQDEVIRCAITLKLCQHEETGAIVAALTTSIPEAPGTERNWDYRYCWIRDAYYTVQALNRLGALDVLEKYLAYLRNIVDNAARRADPAALFGHGRARARRAHRRAPRRLSRHGAGARRQCRLHAGPARLLRPDRPAHRRRASSTGACCAWPTSAISPASSKSARWPGRSTTSPTPGCGNSAPAARSTPIRR